MTDSELRAAAQGYFETNNDEVICPRCVHQFRAIPINVQAEIARLKAKEPPHCPTCSCGGPEFETVPKAEFDALLDECKRLQTIVNKLDPGVYADTGLQACFGLCTEPSQDGVMGILGQSTKRSG